MAAAQPVKLPAPRVGGQFTLTPLLSAINTVSLGQGLGQGLGLGLGQGLGPAVTEQTATIYKIQVWGAEF